jgi:hypothetical protein
VRCRLPCARSYSAPTLTLRPHLLCAHTYSTPTLTLRPHLLYAHTDILLSQGEIFECHMRHLSRLFLHHRPKSTLYQSVPASSTSASSQATCDLQPQLHQVPTSSTLLLSFHSTTIRPTVCRYPTPILLSLLTPSRVSSRHQRRRRRPCLPRSSHGAAPR